MGDGWVPGRQNNSLLRQPQGDQQSFSASRGHLPVPRPAVWNRFPAESRGLNVRAPAGTKPFRPLTTPELLEITTEIDSPRPQQPTRVLAEKFSSETHQQAAWMICGPVEQAC